MKLSELFSQFRKIEPDAAYKERARRDILSSPQSAPARVSGMVVFLRIVETGAGLVLAGFFILIITGSLLGPKTISPVQYSVIDPAGLHAEANAIDMQIELADISYPQSSSTAAAESTLATATAMNGAASGISTPALAPLAAPVSSTTPSSSASSTASSSLSIDQALQELSQ